MPTLEERSAENPEELKLRMESKSKELGVAYSFVQYLEQMEIYLLELERRVQALETENLELKKKINP